MKEPVVSGTLAFSAASTTVGSVAKTGYIASPTGTLGCGMPSQAAADCGNT